jgi:hypothetical protein
MKCIKCNESLNLTLTEEGHLCEECVIDMKLEKLKKEKKEKINGCFKN